MSDARAAILARVDRGLLTARLPVTSGVVQTAAQTTAASVRPRDSVVALQERFVSEARALGVDVYEEPSAVDVRHRLAELTAGLRVLTWNSDQLPYGAASAIANAIVGGASRDDQAAADVGVTACHAAIAETGSLALLSKPGCSRAVSLLPATHVAIVEPTRLFAAMGDFFATCGDDIASASNLTFITGPSRTADIELTLTIGVHGPGRVIVVIGP